MEFDIEPIHLLLKDTPGKEDDGAATKTTNHKMLTPILFLLVKGGELIEPSNQLPDYNYQLCGTNIYLSCNSDDAAPLSAEEVSMMEAIDNPVERMNVFTDNRLEMAAKLLPGSNVYVELLEPDLELTLHEKAVVHYKGKVGKLPGTRFGVEILDKEIKLGNSDGCYGGRRYFECQYGYGLFVALGKLSLHGPAEGTTLAQDSNNIQDGSLSISIQHRTRSSSSEHHSARFSCSYRDDSSDERQHSLTMASPSIPEAHSPSVGGSYGDLSLYELSVGSHIQIPSPELVGSVSYGIIKWIGHLPNMSEKMAKIEIERSREGSELCADSNRLQVNGNHSNSPSGKDSFYPLEKLQPDPRFPPVEKQLDGKYDHRPTRKLLRFKKKEKFQGNMKIKKEKEDEKMSRILAEKDSEITRMASELKMMTEKAKHLQEKLDDTKKMERSWSPTTTQPQGSTAIPWKIDRSEVNKMSKKIIGSGAWGIVYSGHYRGEPVALKQVHRDLLSRIQGIVDMIKREIGIMAHIEHPNLVRFVGAVLDEEVDSKTNTPIILLELLDMNLREAYETEILKRDTLVSIFCDVAYALHYLHEQYEPIIHRDVSATNVLLKILPNGLYRAKVSDFGSANLLKQSKTIGAGTIIYTAPEMFPQDDFDALLPPHTTKIDVFSYGILLLEVVIRDLPILEKRRSSMESLKMEWENVYQLVLQCTRRSPSERPTMRLVLNMLHKISKENTTH